MKKKTKDDHFRHGAKCGATAADRAEFRKMEAAAKAFTKRMYGPKCRDYEPLCWCCLAWDAAERFLKTVKP